VKDNLPLRRSHFTARTPLPPSPSKPLRPPRSSKDHAEHPRSWDVPGVRGRRRRGGEQAAARGRHATQPEWATLPYP